MNRTILRTRANQLAGEVKQKNADRDAGRISPSEYKAFVQNADQDVEEIEEQLKAFDQANKFAGGTEVATGGVIPGMGMQTKGFASVPHNPITFTPAQMVTLEMCAKS